MRFLTTLLVASGAGAVAFAAAPVGTVSSSMAFDLNGVAVMPQGVSSWPVTAGDEVRAGGAPVVIRFQDGSRMTLSEQSRVRLVRNGDNVSVNLVGGDAQFSLTQGSTLQVLSLGRQVGSRNGSITTGTTTFKTQPGVGGGGGFGGGARPDVPRKPPDPVSTQ
jgi:ferric-dicitrate binding protein FerR (iron transport regulator)